MTVSPSLNVTVPVGVPFAGETPRTVAVYVTVCPVTAVVGPVKVVVEPAASTCRFTGVAVSDAV